MKKLLFLILFIPCLAIFHEGRSFNPNIIGVLYTGCLYLFYTYTNFGKSVIKELK